MSYESKNMRLMGGVPGQQLFLYRSTDALADVVASGYFDRAVEEYNLDTGDVILACTGPKNAAAVDLLVATNTAGVVTVVNGS
ncbi:hypothetical protein [Salidesulfovibrio onnuriiensis]|uniref:hypothetical protein n=1 Tax=Salidesulfovibrio onnuriiensis TaxID=2583823 RepID=UPI0011C9D47C|nr:hypothetical protein [Salidesulfovibrio onnuriiensis]